MQQEFTNLRAEIVHPFTPRVGQSIAAASAENVIETDEDLEKITIFVMNLQWSSRILK